MTSTLLDLKLKAPLFQSPMAGVQDHRLAMAVCEAGGLGALPAAMLSLEQLDSELAQLSQKTKAPFNVNFFCHATPEEDPTALDRWHEALKPYYQEFGLDPRQMPQGAGRQPFSPAAAEVLEAYKPAVVSFHFGLPEPRLIQRVKSWGSRIIASATTVKEALWLQSQGADAVIAQGLEAGGHRGHFLSPDLSEQMGTFALVPALRRTLAIPVVAAGGIADAQGVRSALTLGADGIQAGTVFLCANEATTSRLHRQALRSQACVHTALTNLLSGRPARGMVNRLMHEMGPLSTLAPAFPLATAALVPLRAAAEAQGRTDFSPLWCGQNASACEEKPAAELVQGLIRGF